MENMNALQIIALEEAKQEWLSLKKVSSFLNGREKNGVRGVFLD